MLGNGKTCCKYALIDQVGSTGTLFCEETNTETGKFPAKIR